jgi:outer membrane biosynthesis protein TonB
MQKLILLALLGLAAASAACASAQAKAPADRPTLEVPPPPTRTIEPTPRPEPIVEPVPDLPPVAPPNPRPRTAAANREPVRTEPKPEAPPPEPVVTSPPPVAAPPQLRTPATADGAEADRQVRAVLENARRTLGSIDYRQLSKARQKEYDDAGRLIVQAEDHLKTSSFELARNLAEKADGIAKELKGR